MVRLTTDAARAYIAATLDAFVCGAVATPIFNERMRFVQQHGDPSSREVSFALGHNTEEGEEDDWPLGEELAPDGGPKQSLLRQEGGSYEPPVLMLIPAGVTGLSGWEFHQYDHDYHPSVPHGHLVERPVEKLDAYLGHVYRGSRQLRREPRRKIVALWNDQQFRVFARDAIFWYMKAYPRHVWPGRARGMPSRLPRKRRP